MATHQINFTNIQEKGLGFVTDRRNAELIAADPKATPLTPDEYLQFVIVPVGDDWARQAGIAVTDPIVEKLKEAIASGDDTKIQAVKDALGIASLAEVKT